MPGTLVGYPGNLPYMYVKSFLIDIQYCTQKVFTVRWERAQVLRSKDSILLKMIIKLIMLDRVL